MLFAGNLLYAFSSFFFPSTKNIFVPTLSLPFTISHILACQSFPPTAMAMIQRYQESQSHQVGRPPHYSLVLDTTSPMAGIWPHLRRAVFRLSSHLHHFLSLTMIFHFSSITLNHSESHPPLKRSASNHICGQVHPTLGQRNNFEYRHFRNASKACSSPDCCD